VEAFPPREAFLARTGVALGEVWNISGAGAGTAGSRRGGFGTGLGSPMGGGGGGGGEETSLYSLYVSRLPLLAKRKLPQATRLILEATGGHMPQCIIDGGPGLQRLRLVDPLLHVLATHYTAHMRKADMLPRLPAVARGLPAPPPTSAAAEAEKEAEAGNSWPEGLYVTFHDWAIMQFVRYASNPQRRRFVRPHWKPDSDLEAGAWDGGMPMAPQRLDGPLTNAELHVARVHHALYVRLRQALNTPLCYRHLQQLTAHNCYADQLYLHINALLPTNVSRGWVGGGGGGGCVAPHRTGLHECTMILCMCPTAGSAVLRLNTPAPRPPSSATVALPPTPAAFDSATTLSCQPSCPPCATRHPTPPPPNACGVEPSHVTLQSPLPPPPCPPSTI
jgi:hypothetical protein